MSCEIAAWLLSISAARWRSLRLVVLSGMGIWMYRPREARVGHRTHLPSCLCRSLWTETASLCKACPGDQVDWAQQPLSRGETFGIVLQANLFSWSVSLCKDRAAAQIWFPLLCVMRRVDLGNSQHHKRHANRGFGIVSHLSERMKSVEVSRIAEHLNAS